MRITLALRPTLGTEAQVAAALAAAQADGRLAAALQVVGVQLAGSGNSTAVEVVSAAAPTDSKATVGAAVGASAGGAALFGLAAAAFLLVRRSRARAQRRREELPVSMGATQHNGRPASPKLKVRCGRGCVRGRSLPGLAVLLARLPNAASFEKVLRTHAHHHSPAGRPHRCRPRA